MAIATNKTRNVAILFGFVNTLDTTDIYIVCVELRVISHRRKMYDFQVRPFYRFLLFTMLDT